MDFTKLRSFNKTFPLYVEKYELFGVDENSSITEKINSMVQALNKVGKLSNDVLKDWNKVMEWAMGEGLDESVDKKVEAMILSGKFDEILQTSLTEINGKVDGFETQLAEKVNQKNVGLFRKINKKVNFPTGFIWNNAPITIYKNALSEFTTDFDVAKYQHVGAGKTYYVALNGLDTNDGLTSTTPLASVKTAILKADVDIVLIAAGYYPRNQSFSGTDIPKNVSIKAMPGAEGKVTLTPYDVLTFTVDATYTNTYKVARSAIGRVFDSKYVDSNGDYQELVKKTSIADVNTNPGSYYADGTNLYIRLSDSRVPDNLVRVFLATVNLRHIGGSTVYVEGINFEGGMSCIEISNHLTNGLYPKFYAKNCKFKYSSDASGNNVSIKGAQEAFLQDCTSARSINDGFNYHINNGVNPNVIEVNCIGRNNGIESDNDNGSTMHDGGKIIRVNGAYFENIGPNVADVNSGSQSWNLGCIAYDSKAITVLKQCDFQTSETGASGWYDGCVALTTVKSLYADTSIAYTKDCYFEQTVDTNQVY